jgi:hypothetical protein
MISRSQSGSRWLLAMLLVFYAFFVAGTGQVLAHETPIALLHLNERSPGVYSIRWTYSSSLNIPTPTAVFPQHCAVDERQVDCGEQGLVGPLTVDRIGERYSAAVIRIAPLEGEPRSYTVTAAQPVVNLTADGVLPLSQVMAAYVPLGIEHIMLGIDHLPFVFGLMLLVKSRWMLFKTITAFTVAHSFTLAAATFGWVGVPERPVNAAIALSIVIVAIDVLKVRRGEPCLSVRFPWVVAFGFGLLHGFGFAGALSNIGLPAENLPAALLFFNVGVEIGQIGFVLIVLALAWAHRILRVELPRWTESAAVYAMGSVAGFWTISRFLVLLSPPAMI